MISDEQIIRRVISKLSPMALFGYMTIDELTDYAIKKYNIDIHNYRRTRGVRSVLEGPTFPSHLRQELSDELQLIRLNRML